MRSRFAKEMERDRQQLPAFIQMYALSDPIVAAAADDDASFFLYGQAAALVKEDGAGDLVERLVRETRSVLERLMIA